MNAYVHAPKDDLYQRSQWRDPYPAGRRAEFEREIALARRLGIEWVPRSACGERLLAIDGAGGRTALRLRSCG